MVMWYIAVKFSQTRNRWFHKTFPLVDWFSHKHLLMLYTPILKEQFIFIIKSLSIWAHQIYSLSLMSFSNISMKSNKILMLKIITVKIIATIIVVKYISTWSIYSLNSLTGWKMAAHCKTMHIPNKTEPKIIFRLLVWRFEEMPKNANWFWVDCKIFIFFYAKIALLELIEFIV